MINASWDGGRVVGGMLNVWGFCFVVDCYGSGSGYGSGMCMDLIWDEVDEIRMGWLCDILFSFFLFGCFKGREFDR